MHNSSIARTDCLVDLEFHKTKAGTTSGCCLSQISLIPLEWLTVDNPVWRRLVVAGMGVARFKVFFSSNDGAMTAKTSNQQVLTLDWQLSTTAGTGYFLSCGYGVTIMCRMPWLCISAVPLSVLRRQFQVVWVVARLFALPITPAWVSTWLWNHISIKFKTFSGWVRTQGRVVLPNQINF